LHFGGKKLIDWVVKIKSNIKTQQLTFFKDFGKFVGTELLNSITKGRCFNNDLKTSTSIGKRKSFCTSVVEAMLQSSKGTTSISAIT